MVVKVEPVLEAPKIEVSLDQLEPVNEPTSNHFKKQYSLKSQPLKAKPSITSPHNQLQPSESFSSMQANYSSFPDDSPKIPVVLRNLGSTSMALPKDEIDALPQRYMHTI